MVGKTNLRLWTKLKNRVTLLTEQDPEGSLLKGSSETTYGKNMKTKPQSK